MFHSPKRRIQALLDVVDDMLAGAPEPEAVELVVAPHPHRRPVQLRIERRAGMTAPRPMHCISPVHRPAAPSRDRDSVG